ncbi:hypothetical protein LNO55_17720 [Klebsiella pneumoniae subsp. pneumoniae]|nr:hypothetical protein [Klebsiella pneumoniae subsp. pneumoniae]
MAQVKEIIARVRRGGEESMLELDVMKMLTSYFFGSDETSGFHARRGKKSTW